ncbi:uncharacterized protein DUF2591 [Cupriavidus metallidurans]|uniref:phage protein NinX family protein n=1 Tax=Cupriavidus metallidurans TaxID=119219 RepID=UPI000493B1BB|nr:phage protein NinX family protein [Cupriavidus metallidurans]MDE4918569.1 DUF2591 family protein [Cupriavidus metallidurans]
MKVSELEGYLLNYWVARADGLRCEICKRQPCETMHAYIFIDTAVHTGYPRIYSASTYWNEGGEIIERERIGLMPAVEGGVAFWIAAHPDYSDPVRGSTALIAAMRAYVASKFGNEVTEAAHG